jgi:hypothetical protein
VSSELRMAVERWKMHVCFHRRKRASELADIFRGATLKLTTQCSIDGSMDRSRSSGLSTVTTFEGVSGSAT